PGQPPLSPLPVRAAPEAFRSRSAPAGPARSRREDMVRPHYQSRSRRGVAAVEFAFLLPVILTLLVGIWEVGRMIQIQQTLYNAAREGARQAASGQMTATQVKAVVTNYLTVAGVPTTNVNVTVNDLTNPGVDPTAATTLDKLQITITMPFQDVSWSVLSI